MAKEISNENSGKLESFLENYGSFVSECSTNIVDLDLLITSFTDSIPPPPENSENAEIQEIYKKALSLSNESAADLVTKLRSLKEDKLHEVISYTEQLNITLNGEYEKEINRAVELGIYGKGHCNN